MKSEMIKPMLTGEDSSEQRNLRSLYNDACFNEDMKKTRIELEGKLKQYDMLPKGRQTTAEMVVRLSRHLAGSPKEKLQTCFI